jgi:hypothetical protein
MNTNGGADTNVREDWHAMLERQRMDERGPGFEALAEKLVTDLHCPREKVPHLLVELRRLISAAKQRLAETTEVTEEFRKTRRGRYPDQLRRDVVRSILQFYTETTGRPPGRGRKGPANRIVTQICRFFGWKANSEVAYLWIREAMTRR